MGGVKEKVEPIIQTGVAESGAIQFLLTGNLRNVVVIQLKS